MRLRVVFVSAVDRSNPIAPCEERRVSFIGHSLGAIIIRNAFTLPDVQDLFQRHVVLHFFVVFAKCVSGRGQIRGIKKVRE